MGFMVVDKKIFNKLSDADKRVVHESVSAAFERLDDSNRSDDQKAKQALQANGIELVPVEDAAYAGWQSIASTALNQLAEKDVFEKALFNAVRSSVNDHRQANGG